MSNYLRIDLEKTKDKWSPVLEKMGVNKLDESKMDWLSEYAEYHAIYENAYANISNTAGMGTITAPQASLLPGTTIGTNWSANGGALGSGDLGQNLLPVAMKIAAQTIGLDLVAVKPTPGPKIDLLYIDFQYDETNGGNSDERPQIFKLDISSIGSATSSTLTGTISTDLNALSIIQNSGGLVMTNGNPARIWTKINNNPGTFSNGLYYTNVDPQSTTGYSSVAGVVEFLGYSRIDGFPMFRAYKQANTAQTNSYPYINNYGTGNVNGENAFSGGVGAALVWGFDPARNTFGATLSMLSQITQLFGVTLIPSTLGIELVSALEDQLPGFVSNFNQGGLYPMDRAQEEDIYAGEIGPRISTKSIAVGSIEVSSALRRTQIEDIKANTGMDIVQKMESILVNELSQTISKQIVQKIFQMGGLNRSSAPAYAGTLTAISNQTVFDLDTAYVAAGPGGETTHAVQRKLITKLNYASHYLVVEGRVGPAQFAVTNGALAASLMDISGYTINPSKNKMNASGQLYPIGTIGDIQIYVDPYMKFNDNRIVIGRKNNPDQPGIIFVPYLMAQSISIISEATFAPRLLLRSRYAVAEVGWYPQKQFMTLVINDANQYLN